MTDLHILEGGGRVLVVTGEGKTELPSDWTDDPRVIVWATQNVHAPLGVVPSNVRAILTTRHISHQAMHGLREEAKRLRIVIFPMMSPGEIKTKLATMGIGKIDEETQKPIAPVTLEKELKATERGAIKKLVEENVDWSKPAADEARRLLALAESRGIKTTFSSIEQRINKDKREKGLTASVPSIQRKKSREEVVLKALDDAIAGLQLVRESVQTLEKENREITERFEKLKAALGD